MYEAMLKQKADAKSEFLDSLVEKRNKGEVGQLVDGILGNGGCKSK